MIYVMSGGGLSRCTIIVHAETGSTVAAYSNSGATTLVKAGKEIGTSGSYVITCLNTGTYYVKATKGAKSRISSAITFTAEAVKEVTLTYALYLFKAGEGAKATWTIRAVSGQTASYLTTIGTDSISVRYPPGGNENASADTYVDVTGYDTLYFDFAFTENDPNQWGFTFGISNSFIDPEGGTNGWNNFSARKHYEDYQISRRTESLDISGYSGNKYIGFGVIGVGNIYNVWLE